MAKSQHADLQPEFQEVALRRLFGKIELPSQRPCSKRMRPLFTALLILAYVAIQAIAIPHTHGPDGKPHSHTARHFHSSSHAHHGHHGSAHHHHHSERSTAKQTALPRPNQSDQHEADANYLPDILLERVAPIDLTLADGLFDLPIPFAAIGLPSIVAQSPVLLTVMATGDISGARSTYQCGISAFDSRPFCGPDGRVRDRSRVSLVGSNSVFGRFVLRGLAMLRRILVLGCLAVMIGGAAWVLYERSQTEPTKTPSAAHQAPLATMQLVRVSSQARKNLRLVSGAIQLQEYWRKILVPGLVIDRPGFSDRGVTAPAVGSVVEVYAFPGDMVRPGDRLLSLQVFSEYLQNTQAELFKATRETQLLTEQRVRLTDVANSGAIPQAKLIEVENQLRRQSAALQAYRQDLLTRGLTPDQISGVAEGRFVSTIEVVAPPRRSDTQQNPSDTEGLTPKAAAPSDRRAHAHKHRMGV